MRLRTGGRPSASTGASRTCAAWKGVLARRATELAELVHRENGKPVADALLEITLAVDHLEWAASHARRVLGRRKVPSGLTAANQTAWLEYAPLGVVGVIGPWNYPVFTPMGSIAYALAAGNAVVFKPSEHTPAVGEWLVRTFQEAVPQEPVLSLVTGFGDTGAALCRSGVGKIAFTGSSRTGRKVMAACAEGLVPVLMECGGKDAMVVADDADIDSAADAAVWGGMSNAGQTCIGIERVYVADAGVRPVPRGGAQQARRGAGRLGRRRRLRADHHARPGGRDRGPPRDAFDRGATAVVGGRDAVHRPFVDPVVLTDVPEDAKAVTDETFGPTLTVQKVRDAEEGVEKANATSYGLAGAIFSASKERAMELAGRMRSGMTSINSVIAFASVPSLPFGGVGESGFGRIHGADGLREFTRPKAITSQRFALPVQLTSFSRPASAAPALAKVLGLLHGRSKPPSGVARVAAPRPRSDEERQLIFRAALRVMRVNGYADAQISDILAEAGLGTRAFYRHFSSKDDLVIALFEDNASRTTARLEARVQAAPTARDQLLAWIDEMLDLGYDGRRSARAQLFAASAVRVSSADAERRILATLHAPLVEVLRGGAASGEFDQRVARAGRGFGAGAGLGVLRGRGARPAAVPREAARAHVLRFCLPALGLAGDQPV